MPLQAHTSKFSSFCVNAAVGNPAADTDARAPTVTARTRSVLREVAARCRPSQPLRTAAGAARSMSSCESKCERVAFGLPTALTTANSPDCHIGSSGRIAG